MTPEELEAYKTYARNRRLKRFEQIKKQVEETYANIQDEERI